jgi:hypothetical protein
MKKTLLVLGALAVAGCASDPQLSISGLTLTVKDQLYVSRPMGYFCDFVPQGQITLQLVDYRPACSLDRNVGDPDPRISSVEHSELDIILGGMYTGGVHENLMNPFSLSKIDCVSGPGDNGTAYFMHYPANSQTPDTMLQVDTGTVKLDTFDKTSSNAKDKATKGTFDLTFGGSHVTGSINAAECDVSM